MGCKPGGHVKAARGEQVARSPSPGKGKLTLFATFLLRRQYQCHVESVVSGDVSKDVIFTFRMAVANSRSQGDKVM